MAVNLVTVTGNLETLIGANPTSAVLWFKLNRPEWNADGDIFAPEHVQVTPNGTGAFTVALQSTAPLLNGAFYTAIIRYRDDATGLQKEYTLGSFTLPTGGPFQLGDMLATFPASSFNPNNNFTTREAFIAALPALSHIQNGQAIVAAGLSYVRLSSSNAIRDLPGFVPAGDTTPMHFGATGTGVKTALSTRFATLAAAQSVYPFATDLAQSLDWAGWQAAHNYEKAKLFTPVGVTNTSFERSYNYYVRLNPGRTFWLNESLDLTGIRTAFTKTLTECEGATVIGEAITGDYPVIDMLDSRQITFHGGTFTGYIASPPRCMFQWGRALSGLASSHIHFSNMTIQGAYTLAGIYNYASEESHMHHCVIRNAGVGAGGEHTGGRSFALVQDGDHYFGAKSKYQSVAPLNTPASFLQDVFSHCDFRQNDNGSAVFLSRTAQHSFPNCYFVSEDFAAFEILANTAGQSAEMLDLSTIHVETDMGDTDPLTGCKYAVYFDAVSPGTVVTCNFLKFSDSGVHAQVSFFGSSPNVTTVNLGYSKVSIGPFPRDIGQTLFDTPSKFQASGDWALLVDGSTSIRLSGMASFSGVAYVLNAQNVVAQGAAGTYSIVEGGAVAAQGRVFKQATSGNIFDDFFIDSAQVTKGSIRYSTSTQTYSIRPDDGDSFTFSGVAFYPSVSDAKDLGLSTRYWDNAYLGKVHPKTIEYVSGAGIGGTVTQLTSKTTGVTLDKICGRIVTAADALGAGASADFVFTNALIGPTSVVAVTPASTASYTVQVLRVASGSATIRLNNITAGSLAQAVNINFEVRTIALS